MSSSGKGFLFTSSKGPLKVKSLEDARLQDRALPFQSRESFIRSEYDQRYSRTTKTICVVYGLLVTIMSAILLYGWMDFYGTDSRLALYSILLLGIVMLFVAMIMILINSDWAWTRIEVVRERRGVDVEDIEPFSLDDYGQKVKDTVLNAYDKMEYDLVPAGERLVEKYDVRYTDTGKLVDDM